MRQPAGSAEQEREQAGMAGHARKAPGGIESVVTGLMREGGVRRVLGYLNTRTRYRFTGVYHVDPPLLRNMHLFDRENPALECSGAVSRLDETYCSITANGSAPFTTADSTRDPRLTEHAAREAVLCYVGVPIRLASGATWGTLCHFDLRPRLTPDGEIAVLEVAAPLIGQWICVAEEGRPVS